MTMSWSDLPADLVAAVADRIGDHADFACFHSVCPSWHSASAAHGARRSAPLLLLPAENHFRETRVDRRVWSLADDTIASIPAPAARGNNFHFASPRGWTLAVTSDFSATLLHPFTGASASLPTLPPSLCFEFIVRDMAWDRSPHGVMIGVERSAPTTREYLCAFFCRPGDRSWSPVECSELDQVSSITYCDCDGVFYLFDGETRKTVGPYSETFAVASVIQPPEMLVPEHLRRGAPWDRRKVESTLIVSSSDFLVIVRTHLLHPGETVGSRELFKAFRWDRRRGNPTGWAEVDDIDDRAVFVNGFRGFCVEANRVNGVRRNCMYAASSYQDGSYTKGRYAVSVLDLAGLTTDRLSLGNLGNCRCRPFWHWPSWCMPNLH
ncbi:hypothetical protein VPH35_098318 [Triticum aestivum]